ncbi:MAG: hypothetical protein HQL46_05730 [Gammaproteobacteria bacterium]|nr:hypothetical protein [Gammaproteobacteria bacterium]
MLKNLGMYSLIISSSFLLNQNLFAKNFGDYVFPPLEDMETTAEQIYTPDTYMSYSDHNNNNSFFQQSDYVFPDMEKPVKLKSNYPASSTDSKRSSYIEPEISDGMATDRTDMQYYSRFSDLSNSNDYYNRENIRTNPYNRPAYNDISAKQYRPDRYYEDDSIYYVSPEMKKSYRYPDLSSKYSKKKIPANNQFFDMTNWYPMTTKMPIFSGMGKSSPFSRSGFMPGFF